MNVTHNQGGPATRGILVRGRETGDANGARHAVLTLLDALDLAPHVMLEAGADALGPFVRLWLSDDRVQAWAPAHDTLQLCQTLELDTLNRPGDLMREIVLTLLMGPVAFEFPSLDELVSAARIRRIIGDKESAEQLEKSVSISVLQGLDMWRQFQARLAVQSGFEALGNPAG